MRRSSLTPLSLLAVLAACSTGPGTTTSTSNSSGTSSGSSSGTSSGGASCALGQQSCATLSCCSGTCSSGVCVCTASGGNCVNGSECCSGVCASGLCAPCNGAETSCSANANCCSGVCSGSVCIGSAGGGGSCTYTVDSVSECADYTGSSFTATAVQSACTAQGDGVYSANDCSTANLLGTCTLFGGTSTATVLFFYSGSGMTATQAQSNCTTEMGTWTNG